MISGFTYIHNALKAGIPIRESINAVLPYVDEMVVVDAESNDDTRELLEQMDVRIINAKWGTDGGETLKRLHAMNTECEGDTIIHFEADEVFDDRLIKIIVGCVCEGGATELTVMRLQVEQNFQRIRWYPEEVHRVFKKGSVIKEGHTTNKHPTTGIVSDYNGFLWDVTNCFRDNWMARVEQQAELRSGTSTPAPSYRMVPLHFLHPINISREEAEERLKEPHWTWTETPLNIPEILKPLVGKTKYE